MRNYICDRKEGSKRAFLSSLQSDVYWKEHQDYRIGQGQWAFLTQLLFNYDGITQEELSELLNINKANTARALKKLEDEGYVYRTEDPADARKKIVYVTEKSKVFEQEFHEVFKGLNRILAKDFTEEEKETAEVLEEYEEGIAGIREGEYGVVLFYFHKSEGYQLTTLSRRTNQITGVFSTRSPNRPNGIGMSIVRFVKKEGRCLTFEGVDMLDGTPVLDIKPYSSELCPAAE